MIGSNIDFTEWFEKKKCQTKSKSLSSFYLTMTWASKGSLKLF